MLLYPISASVLNPTEVFLEPFSERFRMVVRMRKIAPNTIEILSGYADGSPGNLQYTQVPCNYKIMVPLA